jgi:hypothetical protein
MKKLFVIVIAVFLLGVLFSSCKTHEKCPAYGKANNVKSEKPI